MVSGQVVRYRWPGRPASVAARTMAAGRGGPGGARSWPPWPASRGRQWSRVGGAGRRTLDLEADDVHVAPVPLLARLERLDERVGGGVEMGGGVLVRRAVAAADVAALGAAPQVDPAGAHGEALHASVAARRHVGDR